MTSKNRLLAAAACAAAAGLIPVAAAGHHAQAAAAVSCRPGSGVDTAERHITVIRITLPDGPVPFVVGHYHEFVECPPLKLTEQLELEQRIGRIPHRHWVIRAEQKHDFSKTKKGETVVLKVEYLCSGPSWWRERLYWSASIAADGTPHPPGHEAHWYPKDRGIRFKCAR